MPWVLAAREPAEPLCQAFADDVAARRAEAAEKAAEAYVATTESLNDFVGTTADASGSPAKSFGRSGEVAEQFSHGATAIGMDSLLVKRMAQFELAVTSRGLAG